MTSSTHSDARTHSTAWRKAASLAAAVIGLAVAAPAHAWLLGTTATASMSSNPGNNDVAELKNSPDYGDRTATVVDPGPAVGAFVGEFFIYDSFGAFMSVDIKDDRIHFRAESSRTFGENNFLTLSFAGLSDAIGGISFENIFSVNRPDGSTPWLGVGSFTSNSITIDLSQTVFLVGGKSSSFDVVLNSVPEPSTLALAGASLAVLGASAARRRRKP